MAMPVPFRDNDTSQGVIVTALRLSFPQPDTHGRGVAVLAFNDQPLPVDADPANVAAIVFAVSHTPVDTVIVQHFRPIVCLRTLKS